jgi:hypothetical protein
MILHFDDPLLYAFKHPELRISHTVPSYRTKDIFQGKDPYEMLCNPTAENMAMTLGRQATTLLEPHNLTVVQVRLWETPNCSAIWKKGMK